MVFEDESSDDLSGLQISSSTDGLNQVSTVSLGLGFQIWGFLIWLI